jgi:hypothetical protein
MDLASDLSPRLLAEFANFMCGRHLGSGMSRHVYDHPSDPTKVIKAETTAGRFQNVMEWEFWQAYKHAPAVARWLAPCHEISNSGAFLIMTKARDLDESEKPSHLPKFLTDHKLGNFGKIGKQIVCRDYGFVISSAGLTMKKWYGP